MNQLGLRNSKLTISGRSVSEITSLVGSTPLYIYDKETVRNKIKQLQGSMPQEISIHYAVKANPNRGLVHFIAGMIGGLDVTSHSELLLALETQCSPENISMAGPGKSQNDLRSAVTAGIVINVESASEIQRIYKLKDELSISKLRLSIRVNPLFRVKGAGVAMTGGQSQFGVDIESITTLLKSIRNKDDLHGLHIFSGSQNLDTKNLCSIFSETFKCAKEIIEQNDLVIKELNIGGGIGIPYHAGETDVDLNLISRTLRAEIKDWKSSYPNTSLVMELGRYIVGASGYYICQVVDKKVSREAEYLIVNGGLNHHLAATGNFGQLFRKNYPIEVDTRRNTTSKKKYNIVGPLCTPIDRLATEITLPVTEIGDFVIIKQSGAYGFSASPHRFLSHPPPIEILL